MVNTARELADKVETEGNSAAPSSNLTKAQQDATIRKWADWILKQRRTANDAKAPAENQKD